MITAGILRQKSGKIPISRQRYSFLGGLRGGWVVVSPPQPFLGWTLISKNACRNQCDVLMDMYLLLLIYKIPPTVLYLMLFLLLLIYKIPPTLHLHVSFIYSIFMVTRGWAHNFNKMPRNKFAGRFWHGTLVNWSSSSMFCIFVDR
jgi:hypothetical protein